MLDVGHHTYLDTHGGIAGGTHPSATGPTHNVADLILSKKRAAWIHANTAAGAYSKALAPHIPTCPQTMISQMPQLL